MKQSARKKSLKKRIFWNSLIFMMCLGLPGALSSREAATADLASLDIPLQPTLPQVLIPEELPAQAIEIQVTNLSQEAIQGAVVTLVGHKTQTLRTNASGRIMLETLQGIENITIFAPGYIKQTFSMPPQLENPTAQLHYQLKHNPMSSI